jgi:hypothetical protein
MDHFWLLTNTCYGTWLPGDRRGFVGRVWDHRPDDSPAAPRVTHARPGTEYDGDIPGMQRASAAIMKGPPIHFTLGHAEVACAQFQETARHRHWQIEALAIMFNHFHLVVGVAGDPAPAKVLGDFKSWGTRALSARFGPPASGTWWTERGSKRKLPDDRAVRAAVRYVVYDQPNPLVTWSPATGVHLGVPPTVG